ncbi:MAG: HAD hydrolase-like protein [Clostridia bacterium]|nr:HAD hydrolase-like protein [Clostridia bacterium]
MFDLCLFDLDGTLTDPKEGITNCVKYALEYFGIDEKDEATLLRFIGPPLYDSFRGIYGFSDAAAKKAVEKYRERFSPIGIYENTVLDGACTMLKELKEKGKTLALATSKPYVFAEKILEKYDMSKYFDYAVGSELDGTRNYKDEVITEVLRMAKPSDLSRVVMIGDRKQDIIGAKKCGIASIGVRCGYAEEDELEDAGADFIFANLYELTDFLLNNT